MNYILIITLFSLIFVSCIGKNTVAIKSKVAKTQTASATMTVSNIKIINNQFVLTGTNLNSATSIVIKEGTTTTTLAIESQTSTGLIANTLANVSLAAGSVFEFVVSNATASAAFTVDFSLCSSSIGGKLIDCSTTPNDKEVLSYDAVSGKWKPRAVNGLSYQGVWDASSSLPTATTEGDYFIVSVASGSYAVGDWIVYNGTSFEKVSNANTVTSVFTRTGAITATKGDYVLNKMGDVDFTTATPTSNQVLKFNGTNWVPATLSTVESDPNVMTFAKTTLPTCGSSEVLKGNGTNLSCVTVSSGSSSFSGTASRAIVTDGSGALAVSAVTSTELGYISGITSAIQTQINAFQTYAKTPIPTCGAGEVLKSNGTTFTCVTDNTGSGAFSGTASRAVVTDGSGALSSSAVTSTEVGYLSGVTSAIQTQFTNIAATAAAINTTTSTLTSGNIFVGSAGNVAASVAMSGDATLANTGALTIANNSVALGTDTTGNYVLNLTASNGLQATAAAGEGTTPNLVLGGSLTGNSSILLNGQSFSFVGATYTLGLDSFGTTTMGNVDINGGTIDAATITATAAYISTASITNLAVATANISSGAINGTTIGSTSASSGVFTTVAATAVSVPAPVSGSHAANKDYVDASTDTLETYMEPMQSLTSTSGMYNNKIASMTPPTDYLKVCFKNGSTGHDVVSAATPTTISGTCAPGDRGFIMEKTERAAASASNWDRAREVCLQIEMRLPELFELSIVCRNAWGDGPTDLTNNFEWSSNSTNVFESTGGVAVTVWGNGGCSNASYRWSHHPTYTNEANTANFRCVR